MKSQINPHFIVNGLKGVIHNWLSDEKIINYVLSSVSLWKYSGYHIIMFIAALQSIPQWMKVL